nr:MAG TPA: hypothetical protein [Caudoviricetes sp.]
MLNNFYSLLFFVLRFRKFNIAHVLRKCNTFLQFFYIFCIFVLLFCNSNIIIKA